MSRAAGHVSAVRLTLIMCIAETLSMAGAVTYATLLPQLQGEWHLTNTEAGLIGGVFFAGYMTAVPILTSLTDRIDSRRVYMWACLFSMTGAAGFATLTDGLWTALAFQFLIGAGLGGTYMPGLKTLTDHLEGRVQARATGFYTASFGVGTAVSILICGQLGATFGWQWAFVYGAIGPPIAAVLVMRGMPRGRTHAALGPPPPLFDFRPVFGNRATRAYLLGYCAHNYELFGQRAWMVAFLVFSASLQPAHAPMLVSAATLAACITLLGPVMSVTGNELAIRFGRQRVILTFMTASGVVACFLGYAAALPWWAVFALMAFHYGLMLGDSAALTAGAVASAAPGQRGAMMAMYSFIGFAPAFLAPLVFGVVLDLAGGNQSAFAWGLAFASIGVFGVLAPVARWMAHRLPV